MSDTQERARPLRVAILIGQFVPHDVGGAERQADRLAAALARRGHDVTVLTRRWPGRTPRETRDGFTIVRTPIALSGPARTLIDAGVTLRELARMRPDVVLAFQTFVSGWLAALANVVLGRPGVVWVRGENEYRFDRLPGLYGPSTFAWRRARRVLVQTEAHRQALLARLTTRDPGLSARLASSIGVLGNGVEVPAEASAPGDDWLFVGRLIEHKGVDTLLDALARLAGTPAARPLWIVGDGPARPALEARTRSLGVDARFEGMATREALPAFHARACAIILPSTQGEGLPNALLEAMAAGVPIATAVPGVTELVDGIGLLVPPSDPAALAAAMTRMTDPETRSAASTAARTRASATSFDTIAAHLEKVLIEATQPRP